MTEQITIAEYKKRLKKGNKYGAKPKEYRGRIYHSTAEMEYAVKLDWMVYTNKIRGWKAQIPIPIIVEGQKICDYIVDFMVFFEDHHEYHEVKGKETDLWKIKWKLVHAIYSPGDKFVLIKKPF